MKTRSLILGVLASAVVLGVALPPRLSAAVSDDDFNALKQMVQQLNETVQKLQQTRDQDQKTHQQDQQQIQQLREQLGQTQLAVTNAVQKAEAASQVQPVHPVPPGAAATHHFSVVGDAEVQFGKVDGSHSAFAMADFAPIFLFRASDNVLFEAGFDVTLQNNAPNSAGRTTSVDLSLPNLITCGMTT